MRRPRPASCQARKCSPRWANTTKSWPRRASCSPGEGLQPSSKGARVQATGTRRTVVDGPFTEAKELIAGFWLWECKSLDEAIEWAKRCPNPTGEESELEIRQVFEADDFGEAYTPELRDAEARLRSQVV